MGTQLVIAVDLAIDGARLDDFMPLLEANARASLRDEPGCHRFDVCVAAEDPTRIFLYEIYDDEAAFAAHVASAHFSVFDAATGAMIVSKQVRRYRLKAG